MTKQIAKFVGNAKVWFFDYGRIILLIFVAVSCICGIVYGYFSKDMIWGSHGGAMAVAITFFFLFLGDNTPSIIATQRPMTAEPDLNEERLYQFNDYLMRAEEEIAYLRIALRLRIYHEKRIKLPLAISSIVGTFFWAFGETIVSKLIRWFPHQPPTC